MYSSLKPLGPCCHKLFRKNEEKKNSISLVDGGRKKPVFTLGNLANWWEEETKNRFLEKANCIIWQYGNYSADSINKTLNGINTQVSII